MKRLRKYWPSAANLLLCAACILWFWLGLSPGDEMGYSLLVFYLLLPAGALVCAFLQARQGGPVWWVVPLFGALAMLTEYLTFSLANTLYAGRVNPPVWGLLAAGALCALVGIALSKAVRHGENRQK